MLRWTFLPWREPGLWVSLCLCLLLFPASVSHPAALHPSTLMGWDLGHQCKVFPLPRRWAPPESSQHATIPGLAFTHSVASPWEVKEQATVASQEKPRHEIRLYVAFCLLGEELAHGPCQLMLITASDRQGSDHIANAGFCQLLPAQQSPGRRLQALLVLPEWNSKEPA